MTNTRTRLIKLEQALLQRKGKKQHMNIYHYHLQQPPYYLFKEKKYPSLEACIKEYPHELENGSYLIIQNFSSEDMNTPTP